MCRGDVRELFQERQVLDGFGRFGESVEEILVSSMNVSLIFEFASPAVHALSFFCNTICTSLMRVILIACSIATVANIRSAISTTRNKQAVFTDIVTCLLAKMSLWT